jgi:hypothetical protein
LIGLSPAYFISRYTDEFTPSDVARGLAEICGMGYGGFQLEVYHFKNLKLWLQGGARLVRQEADALGLKPTQFVAHFMLAAFENPDNLMSDLGLEEMPAVLDILSHFEGCRIITVPLGAFDIEIVCQPEVVRQQYNEGRDFIERLLNG